MSKQIIIDYASEPIAYLMNVDERLAKLIPKIGQLKYCLHNENPYGFIVHEIIEQMLSTKAAEKIHERLLDLCNGAITPEKINALSDTQIKAIGTSIQKVRYIRSLTDAVISRELDFKALEQLPDSEVMRELTRIRGIGNWTAKMYLIFVLNRLDVLPFEDGAFLQSYKWLYKTDDVSQDSILKRCECWRPYASIAARYMYIALDSGLTKELLD